MRNRNESEKGLYFVSSARPERDNLHPIIMLPITISIQRSSSDEDNSRRQCFWIIVRAYAMSSFRRFLQVISMVIVGSTTRASIKAMP